MQKDLVQDKSKILIICNYYLPGYKAGGGLRTVVNTVERFGELFDFWIITLDHDGDNIPYTSITKNSWNDVDRAKVYYLSKDEVKAGKLRELILSVNPGVIYINSVFSILSIYLLILRKLKLLPQIRIILAPEGELSDGALQLKSFKKKTFTLAAKNIGLYKDLIWKVTAEPEKKEAERFKGVGGKLFIAPNLPSKADSGEYSQELKPAKKSGEVKMVFLSRFGRKKNFKWFIEVLKNISGKLILDIYGPLEDLNYWQETQFEISKLDANIKVNYKGQVKHEEVYKVLLNYHFFVLPTLGENFGHVFIEALAAGCPLLISDRTPWTKLEKQSIGWDLPLEYPNQWIETVNKCIDLNSASYNKMSMASREFADRWLSDPKNEIDTLNVLHYGLK